MAAEEAIPEMTDQADEIDEVASFEEIDKLITVGVNAGDIKKMKDAGYFTVESILMQTRKVRIILSLTLFFLHSKVLATVKGMSEAKIEKIVEAAKKLKVKILQVILLNLTVGYWVYDRYGIFAEAARCCSRINRQQRT